MREYVQVGRARAGSPPGLGSGTSFTNTTGRIVVTPPGVAGTILIVTTLSFLGTLPAATDYPVNGYWWEMYPAGVIIAITVIAFSFVGDALLDALEVRVRRG
jgi:peptide/nickel transport system permease protein